MPEKNPDNNNGIIDTLADMNEAMGTRFDKIDGELGEIRTDTNHQLTEIRGQLDRIEHSILEEHTRRLEALEQKVGIRG